MMVIIALKLNLVNTLFHLLSQMKKEKRDLSSTHLRSKSQLLVHLYLVLTLVRQSYH